MRQHLTLYRGKRIRARQCLQVRRDLRIGQQVSENSGTLDLEQRHFDEGSAAPILQPPAHGGPHLSGQRSLVPALK